MYVAVFVESYSIDQTTVLMECRLNSCVNISSIHLRGSNVIGDPNRGEADLVCRGVSDTMSRLLMHLYPAAQCCWMKLKFSVEHLTRFLAV